MTKCKKHFSEREQMMGTKISNF